MAYLDIQKAPVIHLGNVVPVQRDDGIQVTCLREEDIGKKEEERKRGEGERKKER